MIRSIETAKCAADACDACGKAIGGSRPSFRVELTTPHALHLHGPDGPYVAPHRAVHARCIGVYIAHSVPVGTTFTLED